MVAEPRYTLAEAAEILARRYDPLSDREMQVASLVAEGYRNRDIGRSLGISEHTARSHVRSAMTKLRVPNRTHLARWVWEQRERGERC